MDRRVAVAQLEILYEHIPLALIGSGFMSSMGVWLLYDVVDRIPLLIWYAVVLAMIGIRLAQYFANRRTPVNLETAQAKGIGTGIFSGAFGFVWAWYALAYIQPYDPLLISHVGLLVVCVIAGGMVTQAPYLPSLLAFMIPPGMGASIVLMQNAGEYSYLGFVGIGLFAMALVFSFRIHRLFTRIIDAQFENESLVRELEDKTAIAEEANRAKSKFLADASHDVRQPLNAASLYLSMLKDNPGDREIIQRMQASIDLLEMMYTRVLEVARLDDGSVETVFVHVGVDKLINEIADRHRVAASNKGLLLAHEVTHGLSIETDPVLIVRILDNLVSNAVRYTQQGEIHLQACKRDDLVLVRVKDTGVGIPSGALSQIFDEYYQVGKELNGRVSNACAQNGTDNGQGLGLAIVRRLCELLHIEISVESVAGVGSTFELAIPVEGESAATLQHEVGRK